MIPRFEASLKDAAFNLTMFYRILRVFTDIKDVDGAYWSLLPELQFYLLIFIVFITKQINHIKWVGLIWLILILIENYVVHIRFLGLLLDLQFGGFFIAGILFYKIGIEKENTILNHVYLLFTLIVNISLYLTWKHENAVLVLTIIYGIFYLFAFGKLKWLNNKLLLFFGAISYPLYLIHQNLGYSLIKQFEAWGYTGFYVILIVASFFIIVASFITFYVEKPILSYFRFKNKWNANRNK